MNSATSRPRGRRAWLMVVAVAAVVVPMGVRSVLHPPSTVAAANPVEALLVGDSVMAGMAQSYGLASRQLLAARHSFLLDAKGCRRLITTSCSIGSSPPPSNAISVVRAYRGTYHRALVMAAGYNDSTTGTAGLGAAVDTMMAEAAAQGISHVVWLTYREAGPSAPRFRAHNALLRQKAVQYPSLVLADWAGRSAFLPSGWFSADGIHLGTEATKAMADLIADTLDALPPPPPPPTTTTTGPCQLVDTTVGVSAPAPADPLVTALVGAADVPDEAVRLHLWCRPTTTAAG